MGTNLGVWGWGILKHPSDIKLIYNTKNYQMIQLGKLLLTNFTITSNCRLDCYLLKWVLNAGTDSDKK
jgi:hypothetical protein